MTLLFHTQVTIYFYFWKFWLSASVISNIIGCQPRRIWSVIRHGTRYPKRKVIDAINIHLTNIRNDIFDKRNPKLCPHDIERLRSWASQLNADEEKYLAYEGNDELLDLAERIQNRFPSILSEEYNEEFYKVSSSDIKTILMLTN